MGGEAGEEEWSEGAEVVGSKGGESGGGDSGKEAAREGVNSEAEDGGVFGEGGVG